MNNRRKIDFTRRFDLSNSLKHTHIIQPKAHANLKSQIYPNGYNRILLAVLTVHTFTQQLPLVNIPAAPLPVKIFLHFLFDCRRHATSV